MQEDDRIDLLGPGRAGARQQVTLVLHHADGSDRESPAAHTLTDEQIAWFRAGSALNLIRERS